MAGLAVVALIYFFARTLPGPPGALWSALALVSSVEFIAFSRTVISDMTLAFLTSASLCFFYRGSQTRDPKTRKALYLFMYAAAACATLVKGPVGLFLPAMVIFVYLVVSGKLALVRTMQPFFGGLLFLVIVAPWYVRAEMRSPGYLSYFLVQEHWLRFLTSEGQHDRPWYYFFQVLAVGFLPWTPLLPWIAKRLWSRGLDDHFIFLLSWVVVPFAFFTFSSAKTPEYILPIFPGLALLTGNAIAAVLHGTLRTRPEVLLFPTLCLLLSLAYCLLGYVWPGILPVRLQGPVPEVTPLVVSLSSIVFLIVAVSVFFLGKNFWLRHLYPTFWVVYLIFFLFAQQITTLISRTRSSRDLARRAALLIRPEDQLVIYDAYLSSLPFYLEIDRPIWVVLSEKETRIMGSLFVAQNRPQSARGYGKVIFSLDEFTRIWKSSKRRILVFLKEKDLAQFSGRVGSQPSGILKMDGIVVVSNLAAQALR